MILIKYIRGRFMTPSSLSPDNIQNQSTAIQENKQKKNGFLSKNLHALIDKINQTLESIFLDFFPTQERLKKANQKCTEELTKLETKKTTIEQKIEELTHKTTLNLTGLSQTLEKKQQEIAKLIQDSSALSEEMDSKKKTYEETVSTHEFSANLKAFQDAENKYLKVRSHIEKLTGETHRNEQEIEDLKNPDNKTEQKQLHKKQSLERIDRQCKIVLQKLYSIEQSKIKLGLIDDELHAIRKECKKMIRQINNGSLEATSLAQYKEIFNHIKERIKVCKLSPYNDEQEEIIYFIKKKISKLDSLITLTDSKISIESLKSSNIEQENLQQQREDLQEQIDHFATEMFYASNEFNPKSFNYNLNSEGFKKLEQDIKMISDCKKEHLDELKTLKGKSELFQNQVLLKEHESKIEEYSLNLQPLDKKIEAIDKKLTLIKEKFISISENLINAKLKTTFLSRFQEPYLMQSTFYQFKQDLDKHLKGNDQARRKIQESILDPLDTLICQRVSLTDQINHDFAMKGGYKIFKSLSNLENEISNADSPEKKLDRMNNYYNLAEEILKSKSLIKFDKRRPDVRNCIISKQNKIKTMASEAFLQLIEQQKNLFKDVKNREKDIERCKVINKILKDPSNLLFNKTKLASNYESTKNNLAKIIKQDLERFILSQSEVDDFVSLKDVKNFYNESVDLVKTLGLPEGTLDEIKTLVIAFQNQRIQKYFDKIEHLSAEYPPSESTKNEFQTLHSDYLKTKDFLTNFVKNKNLFLSTNHLEYTENKIKLSSLKYKQAQLERVVAKENKEVTKGFQAKIKTNNLKIKKLVDKISSYDSIFKK
jgi:hypothetical protein